MAYVVMAYTRLHRYNTRGHSCVLKQAEMPNAAADNIDAAFKNRTLDRLGAGACVQRMQCVRACLRCVHAMHAIRCIALRCIAFWHIPPTVLRGRVQELDSRPPQCHCHRPNILVILPYMLEQLICRNNSYAGAWYTRGGGASLQHISFYGTYVCSQCVMIGNAHRPMYIITNMS